MSYFPKPIDVPGVILTPEIQALTECLAENAHKHWSRQRLADGWRYGPRRDDATKEHTPALSPMPSCARVKKNMIASRRWKHSKP